MLTHLAAATGRSQMPITQSVVQQAQHLDQQVAQTLAQQGHSLQGGIAALQELTAALQLVLPLEYAEGSAHFKWAAALEASGGAADAEVPITPLTWCMHELSFVPLQTIPSTDIAVVADILHKRPRPARPPKLC